MTDRRFEEGDEEDSVGAPGEETGAEEPQKDRFGIPKLLDLDVFGTVGELRERALDALGADDEGSLESADEYEATDPSEIVRVAVDPSGRFLHVELRPREGDGDVDRLPGALLAAYRIAKYKALFLEGIHDDVAPGVRDLTGVVEDGVFRSPRGYLDVEVRDGDAVQVTAASDRGLQLAGTRTLQDDIEEIFYELGLGPAEDSSDDEEF